MVLGTFSTFFSLQLYGGAIQVKPPRLAHGLMEAVSQVEADTRRMCHQISVAQSLDNLLCCTRSIFRLLAIVVELSTTRTLTRHFRRGGAEHRYEMQRGPRVRAVLTRRYDESMTETGERLV